MPCQALESVFFGRHSTQTQRTHGDPKIPRPKLDSSVRFIADCPRVIWTWACLIVGFRGLILCPNGARACANHHTNQSSPLDRPSVLTRRPPATGSVHRYQTKTQRGGWRRDDFIFRPGDGKRILFAWTLSDRVERDFKYWLAADRKPSPTISNLGNSTSDDA